MFAINKNSYLHNYYKDINPRLINRSVQQAWDHLCIDETDLEPPFNRLTSEQPCIPVQNIDVTRRPVGLGAAGLLKLRKELHDTNPVVVVAAIESICDLAYDSENAYALINLRVIERLIGLINESDPVIRERVNRTLGILARLSLGRNCITSSIPLLEGIATCLEDLCAEVRMQAAVLVEMLSRTWKTADELISHNYIPMLLRNLLEENKYIVDVHLQSLQSLMYGMHGINVALHEDAFDIFIELLHDEDYLDSNQIIAGILGCLALLVSTCPGARLARDFGLLAPAVKFLHYDVPEIYTNAAKVIMFYTINSMQKIQATTYISLPRRLVRLCQKGPAQIYAIKALSNICECLEMRKFVKKNYNTEIGNIEVNGDEDVRRHKDILLEVIGWVSY